VPFFDFLRRFAAGQPPGRSPYAEGTIALERGRLADALAFFTDAYDTASDDAQRAGALNKRGVTYVRRGERDAALADFIAVLEIDPRYVPTITNLGNLLLEDGDHDEAIEHYEAALRLDDDYHVAHLNLAVAYKKTGRRAESVRHLRRANRLEGKRKRKV
jgi:tetratricopeptide (TPR) repeat protein